MKTKKKKIKASSSQSHQTDSQPSDLNLHTAAVKIAVAQICKSVGYKATQTSALETLTAVTVNYLMSLAKSAATSASSTGRTECNLYDVIRALEDLHADIGFTGNSDLKKRLCLLSDSSILRDTMKFVYLSREIPFAKPLPRRRYTVPANSPCFGAESVKWKHIPRWLPEFPKVVDCGRTTTVAPAASGDESGCEKKFVTTEFDRIVDKLPVKRKKVSFRIGCGGRSVIKMKSGGDLRSGMCKRGKRVLCEIYEDNDDETIVNDSCEFANDYVGKGEKSLLREIHCRKVSIAPAKQPTSAVATGIPLATMPITTSSPGNSSEELGGSSNSLPIATMINCQMCTSRTHLLEENEQLKEENSSLRCELDHLRSMYCNVVTMMANFIVRQPEIESSGKVVEGRASDLMVEDKMCSRLFGASVGAKRVRRYEENVIGEQHMQ